MTGPVLVVEAPDVTIKDLRVEVTGAPRSGEAWAAVKSSGPRTKLSQEEVAGGVQLFCFFRGRAAGA